MALQSGVALTSWGLQAACSWELSWEDKVGDSGSLWPKVPENKLNLPPPHPAPEQTPVLRDSSSFPEQVLAVGIWQWYLSLPRTPRAQGTHPPQPGERP